MTSRFFPPVLAVLLSLLCALAGAQPLPQPQGKVILTITGKISNTNANGQARFDRAMLEALGMQTIKTHIPWYDGVSSFEGVPGRALLERVGAQGSKVTAYALNDYVADIPVDDFFKKGLLLALKYDGSYLTVRDRGPIFVIYPYDSSAELQSQKYYGRSVWQLKKLDVE